MKKKVNLEWYALDYDFNGRKVETLNVLRKDLKERIIKGMNKPDYALDGRKIETLADLKEIVKRELMYHYWSKAEYEMMVCDLFPRTLDELKKVSVYDQLEPNLDRIVEYINNKMELRLK